MKTPIRTSKLHSMQLQREGQRLGLEVTRRQMLIYPDVEECQNYSVMKAVASQTPLFFRDVQEYYVKNVEVGILRLGKKWKKLRT